MLFTLSCQFSVPLHVPGYSLAIDKTHFPQLPHHISMKHLILDRRRDYGVRRWMTYYTWAFVKLNNVVSYCLVLPCLL